MPKETLTVTIAARGGASRSALAIVIAIAFLAAIWTPTPSRAVAIQVPEVSARGVYAFDVATGIRLFAKNEHERMPIGSVVKVVTALVTVEHADLNNEGTIIENDLVDDPSHSNMQLQAGDTLTVSQLLYGLLIPPAATVPMRWPATSARSSPAATIPSPRRTVSCGR